MVLFLQSYFEFAKKMEAEVRGRRTSIASFRRASVLSGYTRPSDKVEVDVVKRLRDLKEAGAGSDESYVAESGRLRPSGTAS